MNPILRNSLEAIRDVCPDRVAIIGEFWWRVGYFPNLSRPRSYNEKLQWLKLNDRNEFYRKCVNKLTAREIIRERIGDEYLIPLLDVFKSPDDLKEELLPDEPFVLKTNHDSGSTKIVQDKSAVDWAEVREFFRRSMAIDYSKRTREWYYGGIEPVIMCEKRLEGDSGAVATDYKIFCFDGKAKIILVVADRTGDKRTGLFDIEWNNMPWKWGITSPLTMDKPSNLAELIAVGEKLSQGFPHLRADLYSSKGRVFAGELSLHHMSGFSPFTPRSVDFEIGKLLILPK